MSETPRLERLWGRRGSRQIADVASDVARGGGDGGAVTSVWDALCHYVEVLLAGGRGVVVACGSHTWCIFQLVSGPDGASVPHVKLDARFEEKYGLRRSPLVPVQCPLVTLSAAPIAEELGMSVEQVRRSVKDIIASVGEGLFRGQGYDLDWGLCRMHLSKASAQEAVFCRSFLADLRAFDSRRETRERRHEFMMAAAAGAHTGGVAGLGQPVVERHRLFSAGWRDRRQQQAPSGAAAAAAAAAASSRSATPASRAGRPATAGSVRSASSAGRGHRRTPSAASDGGQRQPQQQQQQQQQQRSSSALGGRAFCSAASRGHTFSEIAHDAKKKRANDLAARPSPTTVPDPQQLLLDASATPAVVPALGRTKKDGAAPVARRRERPQKMADARRAAAAAPAAEAQDKKAAAAATPTPAAPAATAAKVAWAAAVPLEEAEHEVLEEGALFPGSPRVQVARTAAAALKTAATQQQPQPKAAVAASPSAAPQASPAAASPAPVAAPATLSAAAAAAASAVAASRPRSASSAAASSAFLVFEADDARAKHSRALAREQAAFNRQRASAKKLQDCEERIVEHAQELRTCDLAAEQGLREDAVKRAERERQRAQLRATWANQKQGLDTAALGGRVARSPSVGSVRHF